MDAERCKLLADKLQTATRLIFGESTFDYTLADPDEVKVGVDLLDQVQSELLDEWLLEPRFKQMESRR